MTPNEKERARMQAILKARGLKGKVFYEAVFHSALDLGLKQIEKTAAGDAGKDLFGAATPAEPEAPPKQRRSACPHDTEPQKTLWWAERPESERPMIFASGKPNTYNIRLAFIRSWQAKYGMTYPVQVGKNGSVGQEITAAMAIVNFSCSQARSIEDVIETWLRVTDKWVCEHMHKMTLFPNNCEKVIALWSGHAAKGTRPHAAGNLVPKYAPPAEDDFPFEPKKETPA